MILFDSSRLGRTRWRSVVCRLMMKQDSKTLDRPLAPVQTLLVAFILWKSLLGLIVLCSPGEGYDTSTDLLFSQHLEQGDLASDFCRGSSWPCHGLSKLVRWDAIYFVTVAKRGYVYEQEWAFGWGYSNLAGVFASLLPLPGLLAESLSAILISNLSHLASVLLLFKLCETLNGPKKDVRSCLVVAALHIVAPAGVFLSAPVGESTFAALSFAGYLCYALSVLNAAPGNGQRLLVADVQLSLAGIIFGASCTVRGNGLFNGSVFAAELLQTLPRLLDGGELTATLRRVTTLILAGTLVAVGFASPQYLAWKEYCNPILGAEAGREWCNALPPSIYTFVQAHYWNNGFLRYWTLSNLPLFILAIPMIALMTTSAVTCIRLAYSNSGSDEQVRRTIKARLAIPQLLLAVLAVTNFHVQIITRISSAYPLVYFSLASYMREAREFSVLGKRLNVSEVVVMWMVMYALIQAGLFASFLPPA